MGMIIAAIFAAFVLVILWAGIEAKREIEEEDASEE